jgi:hypothetical protein
MAFAVLLLAIGGRAEAQHCWPSSVALVLRDASGAISSGKMLKTASYTPAPSREVDFRVELRLLGPEAAAGLAGGDSVPVLYWWGRGACRIDITQVVVRRNGREMRLLLDVHLDTQRRPGASDYVIDTPPFRAGTWRLPWCGIPAPRSTSQPALIPADRWVRARPDARPDAPTPPCAQTPGAR